MKSPISAEEFVATRNVSILGGSMLEPNYVS